MLTQTWFEHVEDFSIENCFEEPIKMSVSVLGTN